MNIVQALEQLDPDNDEHWTSDGLPRIDAVEKVLGTSGVKRKDVTDAAPQFTRETAKTTPPEAAPPASEDVSETSEEAPAEEGSDEGSDDAEEAQAPAEAAAAPEPAPTPAEAPKTPEEVTRQRRLKDIELLQGRLAEKTEIMNEASRVRDAAQADFEKAAAEVNNLNRQIERLQKLDPNYGIAGVRDYIAQQHQNRLQRAQGLQRFIEMTGVAPGDVAKAVNPKAPIDQAMGNRKPARGSMRPVRA